MSQKDRNIQVKIEQKISKPVEDIFDAIVNPKKMSQYFVTAASGPMTEGTAPIWTFADVGVKLTINIKKIKKKKLILFEWPASGVMTEVEIVLEPVSKPSTLIKIRESEWNMDIEDANRAMQQTQGWIDMLLCMKAFLEYGIDLR